MEDGRWKMERMEALQRSEDSKGLEDKIHRSYPPPHVHLALDFDILKSLFSKPLLAERAMTSSHGTRRGTMAEDAIDAGLTHAVVAFWIDEEAHIAVEISRGFANRADF